jgi:hypothetical protein
MAAQRREALPGRERSFLAMKCNRTGAVTVRPE